MAEPHTPLHSQQHHKNPSTPKAKNHPKNPLHGFLYRAVFLIVFIALLPLFPSQPPENTSQGILSRSWELLHLLFVGIVVSYGFFSCRNTDTHLEKELQHKATETPESYVTQFLHGSSVFYDDDEGVVDHFDCPQDETKTQTWNSRHYRNQDVISVANEGRNISQAAVNRPLQLPVRSLRPCAKKSFQLLNENEFKESMDARNEPKDDIVLQSPIPWRSRSGKMELKDESEFSSSSVSSSPRSLSSVSFRSSRTNSPNSSPRVKAKSINEYSSKSSNRFFASSPPPAPPPPPPFIAHSHHQLYGKPVIAKSLKDELKYASQKSEKAVSGRSTASDKPRSMRTVRAKALQSSTSAEYSELSISCEARQAFMPCLKYEQHVMNNERIVFSDDSRNEEDNAEKNEVARATIEERRDENEVDKKADEFIAKFREQIRLQRIDSIKRSTVKRTAKEMK